MSQELSASISVTTVAGRRVQIGVRPDVAEALVDRLTQAAQRWGEARAGQTAAYALLGISVVVTEPDSRPPTAAQIKFALDIVRKLGVELPEGALQDRGRMGAFLTRFGGQVAGQKVG